MKFASTVGTILALVVSQCSAKKYINHRLAQDTTGVWGANPSFVYEHPDDREDDKDLDENTRGRTLKGSHTARRASGEPQMPPYEDSEDGPTETYNRTLFYEAEGIDFFKKGIDPENFEWVNPDEVVPGGMTCGFLKPYLGSLSNVNYPRVLVYVCMRFADTQPAAKGNMFVHCGGPGALSGCLPILVEYDLSDEVLNTYNVLAIDQRGLGRSWPSFIQEECSSEEYIRAENGTIVDIIYNELNYNVSVDDPESIKASLQPIKTRVQNCWTCAECDFFLNATQEGGNVTQFHFLEYSGTRQLAEDILRMTILLNAPRMHVYGISYGTTVFATFATIFPDDVGLFVLDSCSSAVQEQYHQARTAAIGTNDRIDYIIYSCSARNTLSPGSCPVQDMRQCVGDLSAGLQTLGINPGTNSAHVLGELIQIMFANLDRAEEICEAASRGDIDTVDELYNELRPDEVDTSGIKRQMGGDPASQPSISEEFVYGNPDYPLIEGDIPVLMVQAMDKAGLIYDEDRFALETIEINQKFTGAGTGEPANRFFSEYSTGFYWPKAIPLPPSGNAFTEGIIVGILYDPATPYIWAQELRNGFKNTHLLTSQALQHGLATSDPDCQRHVSNYFETGFIEFVDGQVCGSDFATTNDLAEVFGIYR